MEYLGKFNFTEEEITDFVKNVPSSVIDLLKNNKKLVSNNIKYLIDIGVTNYKPIFKKYYTIFLNDDSMFRGIFDKYDRNDLIDKLAKNINIIEYL